MPLVTPNGDVLVNELNFEVCGILCREAVMVHSHTRWDGMGKR